MALVSHKFTLVLILYNYETINCLVIPSTCIRGRDIVVTLLVRVSVCVSPLNS